MEKGLEMPSIGSVLKSEISDLVNALNTKILEAQKNQIRVSLHNTDILIGKEIITGLKYRLTVDI